MITVLEADEDIYTGKGYLGAIQETQVEGWATMSILAGCITAASAAVADAGIDCIDIVTGGVAAMVRQPKMGLTGQQSKNKTALARPDTPRTMVLDPCPAEHEEIYAACVVGYLYSRDEITNVWMKGDVAAPQDHKPSNGTSLDALMDQAIDAALATRLVSIEAIKESIEISLQESRPK